MPDDLAAREAARWLRFAKEDLDGARQRQSGVPRHSCMLAQQSAEKALKSVLAFLDLRIPKTHRPTILICSGICFPANGN